MKKLPPLVSFNDKGFQGYIKRSNEIETELGVAINKAKMVYKRKMDRLNLAWERNHE